jgi:hypothetical protein
VSPPHKPVQYINLPAYADANGSLGNGGWQQAQLRLTIPQ